MKEQDYINATNLAKARILMNILRDIHPFEGSAITDKEMKEVRRRGAVWVARLEAAVDEQAAEQIRNREPHRLEWPKPEFKTAAEWLGAIEELAQAYVEAFGLTETHLDTVEQITLLCKEARGGNGV